MQQKVCACQQSMKKKKKCGKKDNKENIWRNENRSITIEKADKPRN